MRKFFGQVINERIGDEEAEAEEYGGPLRYNVRQSGFINSRNRPEILAKFRNCYSNSGMDIKEINKAAVQLGGRMLSGYQQTLQIRRENKPYGYSVRDALQEFRKNIKRLDTNLVVTAVNLGMLENHLTKKPGIAPAELQTVMAGVTRRFTHLEAKVMYQTIFHWGPLEQEEDFEYVRSQNDVVIALSYRHQGSHRMSEDMFLRVLDNIFHAVQVLKPSATHIRLWVDAVASRRAQNRKWVSKGLLPYTVFPVCVCDEHFSLRWNRTWINIETILGFLSNGLMVFDQQMVRDMGLVHHGRRAAITNTKEDFYFQGVGSECIGSLKLLASVVLRGALDRTEITWKEDWVDIIRVLSRAAVADSLGARQALLTRDEFAERPIDMQARELIRTLLGYENDAHKDISFLEVRPLNTHIEYVWGHNTSYWQSHKLLVAIKHLGSIDRAVVECAERMLQKEDSVWLVIDFGSYQVAVEFHKEWTRRRHVRLVHMLVNARAFEGHITKSFITCLNGDKGVNYRYMSIHSYEYMSNAIDIMKVIAELYRIGAVAERSEMQQFWFIKNKDVCWTMDPVSY